jgi:hypothetical protein
MSEFIAFLVIYFLKYKKYIDKININVYRKSKKD